MCPLPLEQNQYTLRLLANIPDSQATRGENFGSVQRIELTQWRGSSIVFADDHIHKVAVFAGDHIHRDNWNPHQTITYIHWYAWFCGGAEFTEYSYSSESLTLYAKVFFFFGKFFIWVK